MVPTLKNLLYKIIPFSQMIGFSGYGDKMYDQDKVNQQAHVKLEWLQMVWQWIWIGSRLPLVIMYHNKGA